VSLRKRGGFGWGSGLSREIIDVSHELENIDCSRSLFLRISNEEVRHLTREKSIEILEVRVEKRLFR